jgi:hypothetical protein
MMRKRLHRLQRGRGYLIYTLQHPAEGPALTGYLGPLPVS